MGGKKKKKNVPRPIALLFIAHIDVGIRLFIDNFLTHNH